MLLFRSEEHVARWCAREGMNRGGVLSLETTMKLATAWYAEKMDRDWRRWTLDEAESIFSGLGMVGDFWRLRPYLESV